jgi:hypothetical protein
MGAHPQAIINKRVLEGCDLLIGVFWTRIGTVTPSSESGTVEEIEEHLKTDRPVMLYFSSVPVIPDSVDLDQYQRLKDFRSRCQSRGLYESYLDINDFRSKLYRHLQIKLNNDSYFQGAGGPDADGPLSDIPKAAKLSKEAAFLLKECAADRSGQILYLSHLSGYVLQVRDRNLIEDNNERSRATWIAALEELEQHGFVKPLSDKRNVFKITKGGYDAADRLP